ncbi:MAG TPA: hypothetical protein VM597_13570 [Gemmataceae bacterium]|nr:hypothetical protein [Gemmataceae bacterium]
MRAFVLCLLASALAAFVGCTEPPAKKTNITGTVTRDGKPLVWLFEGGKLHVIFAPVERKITDPPFPAETDSVAGTYRIAALPPGEYLVGIYMFDERHMDALQNRFDPSHTPLRRTVTEDNQVIDIDLPKDLPKAEPKTGGMPKAKGGPPNGTGPKEPPADEKK